MSKTPISPSVPGAAFQEINRHMWPPSGRGRGDMPTIAGSPRGLTAADAPPQPSVGREQAPAAGPSCPHCPVRPSRQEGQGKTWPASEGASGLCHLTRPTPAG